MTSRRHKAVHWIGNVLLIAGAIAVAVWAGSYLSGNIWQEWQSRAFDQRRAAPPNKPNKEETHVEYGGIVGRLTIPRLHVRAMVREGASAGPLSVALGHIPGTAFPGQQGNIGIAGHRDTLFRGLRNVAANDEITFETPRATYVYRVESTEIVKPGDVAVLDPGPNPELTLVTCWPFEYIGSAPDRFIVKAKLVSRDAGQNVITAASVDPPPMRPVQTRIAFDVSVQHSRELVPRKIWFGLTSADPASRTVDGWVWVMPDRRTIWLRNVDAHRPIIFSWNGGEHELLITSVAQNSAKGYLVSLPGRKLRSRTPSDDGL